MVKINYCRFRHVILTSFAFSLQIVTNGYVNCALSLWQILAHYGRSNEKVDAGALIDTYITIGEFFKNSVHHMAETAPLHTWWGVTSELFYVSRWEEKCSRRQKFSLILSICVTHHYRYSWLYTVQSQAEFKVTLLAKI